MTITSKTFCVAIIVLDFLLIAYTGLGGGNISATQLSADSRNMKQIPLSTQMPKAQTQETRIVRSLNYLNVPKEKHKELVKCVTVASNCTGLKEELVVALMSTESEFNKHAISPKKYKGLMQTPKATFKYPEVDTLYGAKILEEKLLETRGNLINALTLYKGGNNRLARKYALQTYSLYQKLLTHNVMLTSAN